MSRLGGAFWFILVVATGMTNFLVKQTVQGLDDQLTQVRRKTAEDQKKIHDLTADWTFLNQPELLADLNNRYVHLVPMSPKQVVTSLDGIPMRPAPPPQEPPPVIAAVSPPPPPVMPVAAAMPMPAQAAAANAPAPVAHAAPPIRVASTPLSLISTAHAATVPAPRAQPAGPVAPPSLDGIFDQVARTR